MSSSSELKTKKVEDHSKSVDLTLTESEDQRLKALVLDLKSKQPTMVIEASEKVRTGWDTDGFPDTQGVSIIEEKVKGRISMIIILEVSKSLDVSLENEEILDLILSQNYVYDNLIEATVQYINDRLKKSKVFGTE